MSDKDDKKELERQRERDMEAEIFGKTMGFVYQKDSEDFQKTVVLKHPHAPGLNREAEEAAKPTPPQPAKPAAPQAAKPTPPQPTKPAAPQAAKPTPPQPTKPAAPQAAKPTPPQPTKPAAPQTAKPTPPQPAKPAAPQAAKPTPPQPAKPAAPQAAKPTPPQPAKPAAPQAAKPTPPQPAKPAPTASESGAIDLDSTLSLDELDAFLLPSELEEAGGGEPATAQAATPEPAPGGLDELDFSELDASLLEEVDTTSAEVSKPAVGEDEDLLAALDELANETAELEKDELPAAQAPKKAPGGDLPDLDLETGDFTTTQGGELLTEEAAATSATGKVLLTEEDELQEATTGLDENEFLMVEEPAPAVTEESLSKEPLFQEQYDEEEEIDTIGMAVPEESAAIHEAEREFITTKPDDLTEAPEFQQPAPQAVAAVSQPATKPRGSGFAVFLALLGIAAAGGVGWLTMQSMDRIDQLEARVAALSGHGQSNAVNTRQDQDINSLKAQTADLEQQIGSLTGVVSDLTKKSNKRKTRPAPKPRKPKPAPKPAPAQSVAPAAASPDTAATGSDWVINLTSVASESAALDEIQRLKGQGIEAESVRVDIDGKPWYRIRVGNFPNEEAANARKDELAQQLGIRDAWVSHR